MSTYRTNRRDQAVADDYLANHAACRKCEAQTPTEDLSAYGAQCKACFDRYCRAAPTRRPPPRTREERVKALEGLRQLQQGAGGITGRQADTVARRLRALEAAGHTLTPGQRWVLERCEAKSGVAGEVVA